MRGSSIKKVVADVMLPSQRKEAVRPCLKNLFLENGDEGNY